MFRVNSSESNQDADRTETTVNLLKSIVEFESPSSNKIEIDRLVDFLTDQLRSRNATKIDRIRQHDFGDLLWPIPDLEDRDF